MKVITNMTQFPWKFQLHCSNKQKKKENKIKVKTAKTSGILNQFWAVSTVLGDITKPGTGNGSVVKAWEPDLDPQNEVQLRVSWLPHVNGGISPLYRKWKKCKKYKTSMEHVKKPYRQMEHNTWYSKTPMILHPHKFWVWYQNSALREKTNKSFLKRKWVIHLQKNEIRFLNVIL